MKRILFWLAVVAFVSGCSTQANATSDETSQPVPTPELARDFSLETLSGETITLSDLRGQWVLVNFWATWCPPCVAEMPYLQQLATERDMMVLGINFQESPEIIAGFVNEYNILFPILLNPDEILVLFYQARSLPRTFVIAPDGTIALRVIGPIESDQFDVWLDEHDVGFVEN